MESKDTIELQNLLTGALIGIARAVDGNEHLISSSTDEIIQEGLSSTLTNFDRDPLSTLLQRAADEKKRLIPHCFACVSPCGKNNDYDMNGLWTADADVRSLKVLLLFGIRGMAAYACHAAAQGHTDQDVTRFFYQALFAIGEESFGTQELVPIAKKAGEIATRCMALLEKGNIGIEDPRCCRNL